MWRTDYASTHSVTSLSGIFVTFVLTSNIPHTTLELKSFTTSIYSPIQCNCKATSVHCHGRSRLQISTMIINKNSKFAKRYAKSQSSHFALSHLHEWRNIGTVNWLREYGLLLSLGQWFCLSRVCWRRLSFCTTHPYINIHPPTQQVNSAVMWLPKILVKVKESYLRISKTMAFFLCPACLQPD